EGSIGHELVIKPVPTDISRAEDEPVFRPKHAFDCYQNNKYYTSQPLQILTRTELISTHLSLLFRSRTPNPLENPQTKTAFMEPDRLQKRFRSKRQAYYKSSRAIDTTIYPEILVIVDYDGYRLHGGDNVQVKRYFVSFWNGVDLRYRLLKGPRIRISIAGIIISR
ncbi:AAEL006766-PA, partial [Aedes aegypti]